MKVDESCKWLCTIGNEGYWCGAYNKGVSNCGEDCPSYESWIKGDGE